MFKLFRRGDWLLATMPLMAIYGARMLGLFMILPVLALHREALGASAFATGLALGAYGLSQGLLQLPFGWLSDRFGRRPLLLIGLGLFLLGSLVAVFSSSIEGIILGRLLQGAGAVSGVLLATLADRVPAERRHSAMMLVGVAIGAAFLFALALGPALSEWRGLRGVFEINAALAALALGLALVALPAGAARTGAAPLSSTSSTTRTAELAPACVAVFALHLALTGAFLALPTNLVDWGYAPSGHWRVYALCMLASLALIAPFAARRRGRGELRRAQIIGVAAAAVGLWLLGGAEAGFAAVIWLTLFFAGFNLLESSLPALLSLGLPPAGRGRAMGIYASCQFLGAFVGGVGAGAILERFDVAVLFYVLATALAAGFAVALGVMRRHSAIVASP